jgi:tetratricopeptide (TPR) repeat protein
MKRISKTLFPVFLLLVATGLSGCSMWKRVTLADDIVLADRRFKQQKYCIATAMYQNLVDQYPRGRTHERLMMRIGPSLYNEQIQALHDSRAAYLSYLDEYPEGHYADEAKDGIERINAIQANRNRVVAAALDFHSADAARLEALLEKDPYSAELARALGDALWKTERYDEACQAYLRAQKINAALREDEVISGRLIVDEAGNIVPLTPTLAAEIERETKPLVIPEEYLNAYKSRSPSDFESAAEIYYNVVGMVHNRSSRYMSNVVVEVRFLNPANRMLDVKKEFVGSMSPGSFRAFSVRADRYDNIYNISRFECVGYEQ